MRKLLLTIMLFVPMLFVAQNKLSPFTNVYLLQHQEAKTDEAKQKALKAIYGDSAIEEDRIEGYLLLSEEHDTEELQAMGVVINSDFNPLFTVSLPIAKLNEVLALSYVERFEMGHPVQPATTTARSKVGVNSVHNGEAGLPQGYTGKNTVIGIVDIGIQYNHVNFYNQDRTHTRVKRVWNQNATGGSSTRPAGYNYGREYSTEEAIISAKYDKTNATHGTHVAGIAAGSTDFKNYYGVAPDADIILVSVNQKYSTSIVDGAKYCFDNAGGKPCVVNLSWGTHIGPHDGTSLEDMAIDAMVGEKRIIVGSAGNEGSDLVHCGANLTDADTVRFILEQDQYSNNQAVCDMWGEEGQTYEIRFCKLDANNNIDSRSEVISTATPIAKTITFNGSSIQISTEVNPRNNKGNIYIWSRGGDSKICVEVVGTPGMVHAWLHYGSFLTNVPNGFTAGDNSYSVGEIGGTANRIITVGSMNSTGTPLNGISSFSSRGPSADGRIKPDVLAPGSVLTSSVNSYVIKSGSDMAQASGYTFYQTESFKDEKHAYGRMQGTSMAAPFMAGVIALWMENARFLTPEMAKDIIMKTSTSDSYTGTTPNNNAGYGKVNALAGMLKSLTYSSVEEIEASSAKLICYPNPVVDQLKVFFPKQDKNVTISVWNSNGQLLKQQQLRTVTNLQEESIDMSNLADGFYLIQVVGDKTNETFKIQK